MSTDIKSQLQQMFDNLRTNTDWNMDGPMLYGYFFTGPNEKMLEPVCKELMNMGYALVALHEAVDKLGYCCMLKKSKFTQSRACTNASWNISSWLPITNRLYMMVWMSALLCISGFDNEKKQTAEPLIRRGGLPY